MIKQAQARKKSSAVGDVLSEKTLPVVLKLISEVPVGTVKETADHFSVLCC